MVSKRMFEGNPSSKERIKNLLGKLEAGTLTSEEARELKPVLEMELEKARKREDISLVTSLTILLAVLGVKTGTI